MEARRELGRGLAVLLAGLPPASGLLGMRRVADIEDDEDMGFVAGHAGREIGVLAAGIGVAVRAGVAAVPFRDLLGILGIADVPDPHRRAGILARTEAVDRGDHEIAVQRHLRSDPVLGSGQELDEFRVGRIGHVENGPAVIEGMAHEEVPAPVGGMLDRQLEGAKASLKPGEADRLDLVGLPARRDRVGERAAAEKAQRRRAGAAHGPTYETRSRRHHRSPLFSNATVHFPRSPNRSQSRRTCRDPLRAAPQTG